MAQARRKKAKASPKRKSASSLKPALQAFKHGLGFFLSGAFVGVLSILLWQGYQSDANDDLGSGLKAMMQQSKQQAAQRAALRIPPEPVLVDNAPRVKPQYDFYTVLPEIEEVLPKDSASLPPVVSVKTKSASSATAKSTAKTRARDAQTLPPGSTYMLQVASYGQQAEAERLKAKLAMRGMRASMQKVSIENKNYFRVRIGPYADYGTMTSDDYKLSKLGFKAMRLRISKAG